MNNFLQNSPIPLKGILGEIKGGNSTVYRCLAEDSKIYAVKVLDGTKERRDSAMQLMGLAHNFSQFCHLVACS